MTAIFVTVRLIHVFLSFIGKRSTQTLKQQCMPTKNRIRCHAYVFRRGLQQIDLNIAFCLRQRIDQEKMKKKPTWTFASCCIDLLTIL